MKTLAVLAALLLSYLATQSSPEPEKTMCLCRFVAPRYSAIARQAVIKGEVHVQVDVASDGTPGGITILDQSNRILGESAVNAIKDWRFCPSSAKSDSHKMVVTVIFKLEGQPTQKWAPTNVTFEPPATVTVTTPSGATLQSQTSRSHDAVSPYASTHPHRVPKSWGLPSAQWPLSTNS
jgi:TonB family protein